MRTLIIGLDAFDPILFERLHSQGLLPNLGALADSGSYSRFQVANPPQSEVSWTSIATGLNPGEHGMFDFVHRDPSSYGLQVSLLPTGRTLGGIQFVRPYNATSIFDIAADQGFPATSLWWPATFPARPDSPVRTLPGLGTPDIQGRMGVGAFYSSDAQAAHKLGKTPVFPLKSGAVGIFTAELEGPQLNRSPGTSNAVLPLELCVLDTSHAEIKIDGKAHRLQLGEWSPIVEIRFKVSWMASVHAITRIVLTRLEPEVQFYFLPLQIHPLHPLWRYGTPASFVKDAWQSSGPFLTLGWPQDTTGLEDGCLSDDQFLTLCETIFNARARLLFHLLDNFQEGLLASVFDSLDRIQHMFWKRRPDVIQSWYVRLDRLVGDVQQRLKTMPGGKTRLLVVSDHGFNDLDYKVHLNRWLIEQGHLVVRPGAASQDLKSVDWKQTKAYAVGLNSLYMNIAGRERDGFLGRDQYEIFTKQLQAELMNWNGPDGRPVVINAQSNEQAFSGLAAQNGPDILVGYTPGYRASSETGLGGWDGISILPNHDHWEADHCFDAAGVPGVLFASQGLAGCPHPSYQDFPGLAIDTAPQPGKGAAPPKIDAQDQEKVEERLKSLGYL
jgi:predicted AlkP superfamily phosphohydrolase/phosphomutase